MANIPTVGAAEMIRMIGVIPEHKRLFINYQVAFLANIFAQTFGFLTIVARPTKVSKMQSEREMLRDIIQITVIFKLISC